MRIGEMLVARKWITYKQLLHGLKLQERKGGKVGTILVRLGYITEEQLLEVLEDQLGIATAVMLEAMVDPSLIKYVSLQTLLEHCVIPIRKVQHQLILAMEDPQNKQVIQQVRQKSGMEVVPVLAARSEIEQTIHSFFDDDVEAV